MDSFDSHLDKAYEKLNKAIMDAIISSEDVKTILTDFKQKDMINNLSILNLILSLEELSDLVFTEEYCYDFEPTSDKDGAKEPQGAVSETRSSPNPYRIDGQNLTPNEILFERFFQKKFDSRKWLKKTGIKL